MIVEIDVTKLGDIAEFQTGPFGTQLKASEYSEHGTPLINVKNIGYGTIIDDDLDFVPDAVCNRLNTHILHNGDIVFGRKGSIDRHGYIGKKQDGWMQGSDCIRMRVISDDFVPRYVSYCLNLTSVKAQISFASVGSTMDSLNTDILKNIRIPYLHLNEQIRIVSLLSDIDAKIDNNNAIAAELENMAKDLYDYWFVQFDFPDENGKPYKSSGGKMVWNEELKREIPEGWEYGNLYSIAEPINGLACQKYRPKNDEESLPVVKIKEMHTGITTDTERVSSNIPEKNKIFDGDILFSWSATLEVMFWFGGNAGLNQHIFKIVPINGYTKEYVYHQYSAYVINFVKMAEARKTTMGHITTDHLEQSRIILPPINVVQAFSKITAPIYEKIGTCKQECNDLASLRDFLLPMLMNGQVKVKGA